MSPCRVRHRCGDSSGIPQHTIIANIFAAVTAVTTEIQSFRRCAQYFAIMEHGTWATRPALAAPLSHPDFPKSVMNSGDRLKEGYKSRHNGLHVFGCHQ